MRGGAYNALRDASDLPYRLCKGTLTPRAYPPCLQLSRAPHVCDRSPRGRRGIAHRRHRRGVPPPAGTPRRAPLDVGRRHRRGRALRRRRRRASGHRRLAAAAAARGPRDRRRGGRRRDGDLHDRLDAPSRPQPRGRAARARRRRARERLRLGASSRWRSSRSCAKGSRPRCSCSPRSRHRATRSPPAPARCSASSSPSAIGWGIYGGGIRLNLARFFRVTSVALVLVAAGLVMSAIHTAHEATWLNSLQEHAARPELARPARLGLELAAHRRARPAAAADGRRGGGLAHLRDPDARVRPVARRPQALPCGGEAVSNDLQRSCRCRVGPEVAALPPFSWRWPPRRSSPAAVEATRAMPTSGSGPSQTLKVSLTDAGLHAREAPGEDRERQLRGLERRHRRR